MQGSNLTYAKACHFVTIVRFDIPDSLLSQIDLARPEYIDRKSFICCLIAKGLTGSDTLVERREELPEKGRATLSEASSSTSTLSSKSSNTSTKKESKARKSRKKTEGSDDFEAFWKAYQSCPSKANNQSKRKAWDEYKLVVRDGTDPADLLRAAEAAVKECQARIGLGEFCAPLPDCFRWLRDERYAVLLESHQTASTRPSFLL